MKKILSALLCITLAFSFSYAREILIKNHPANNKIVVYYNRVEFIGNIGQHINIDDDNILEVRNKNEKYPPLGFRIKEDTVSIDATPYYTRVCLKREPKTSRCIKEKVVFDVNVVEHNTPEPPTPPTNYAEGNLYAVVYGGDKHSHYPFKLWKKDQFKLSQESSTGLTKVGEGITLPLNDGDNLGKDVKAFGGKFRVRYLGKYKVDLDSKDAKYTFNFKGNRKSKSVTLSFDSESNTASIDDNKDFGITTESPWRKNKNDVTWVPKVDIDRSSHTIPDIYVTYSPYSSL